MRLAEKLESLPKLPGVYLMKDDRNKIIYVGKAKNLRARVGSYFQVSADHSTKTSAMVAKIADFDIMLADSEVGALILERTLIKHHKPFYNIRLQDDKEYPYVRIDLRSPWPRVRKVRRRKDDGATYLGPFGNVLHLNTMLQLANRIFPLIKCSPHEFENAKRPCNYYHMKMCLGPCTLDVNRDQYIEAVKDAMAFLQGKNRDLVRELTEKMNQAAGAEEYELAATYRDQIAACKKIVDQKSVMAADIRDTDVVGFAEQNDMSAIHFLLVREGLVTSRDSFIIKVPIQDQGEALQDFLVQYYENKFVPEEICLPFDIPDRLTLEGLLNTTEDSRQVCKIFVPERGTKKRLIEMAVANARYALEESIRQRDSRSVHLDIIKQKLGLDRLPKVIECIDISNIQGTAIVAANVCFVDGRPARDLYRLYNLSDQADAPDDFGSIREVMRRRLIRAETDGDAPDLFVIDGGKGQLSAALEAASLFPQLDLRIVSLAKSRTRKPDNQTRTTGDEPIERSEERIFLPGEDLGVELEVGSPEYRILTHLRDEAHRFAISHHRKRRKKVLHGSALDGVPGIGPALRKKLLDRFVDVEGIRRATFEELRAVPGLGEKAATALFARLRGDEEPSGHDS